MLQFDPTAHAQYALNAQQAYNPGHFDRQPITPDNKLSEGIDSSARHRPAPFLPLVRYDEEWRAYIVISSQKPVAFANYPDGRSFLVPAGYELMLEANDQTLKYTDLDVRAGVKNAQGNPVTVGEAVVDSIKAANIKISPFYGIVNYNVLQHAGGDGVNPYTFNQRNYNPQPGVSVNKDYSYEYPMVKDAAEYAKAPLVGIAAFVGDKAMAGQFITYDKDSNFVLASPADFEYGATKATRIIGQVSNVTIIKDPANGDVKNTFNRLTDVVNPGHLAYPFEGVDNLPGSNNKGEIAKLHYANGFGLIAFDIQTR